MEEVRCRTLALSCKGADWVDGGIVTDSYSKAEKERRRYATIEADKLGHGGTDYISPLFEIDPKTIRRGLDDFNDGGALSDVRQRKKGVDGKAKSNNTPS